MSENQQQTPQQPIQPVPSWSTNFYKVLIGGLVIALIIVSTIAFSLAYSYYVPTRSSSQPQSEPVQVNGAVNSTGINTIATGLIFTPLSCTGACTTVSASIDNYGLTTTTVFTGFTLSVRYSATLLNGTGYDAKEVYGGVFGWQAGTVDLGPFKVSDHGSGGYMRQDFTGNTPDSWVKASGTITLTGNQTVSNPRPVSITWMSQTLGGIALHRDNPSDHGGAFTAIVESNNHYLIDVPNNDAYDLSISWVTSSGQTGICYVATLIGIGLIRVFVNTSNGLASYIDSPTCNVSNQGLF